MRRKGDNDSTESPGAESGWTPDHHNMDRGGHGEKVLIIIWQILVALTCGHTLVAGDMLVSCKECGIAINQGGTADKLII